MFTSNEIQCVNKVFHEGKMQDLMAFKMEVTLIIFKIFQNIEQDGTKTIPLLGIYPRDRETLLQSHTCTNMLIHSDSQLLNHQMNGPRKCGIYTQWKLFSCQKEESISNWTQLEGNRYHEISQMIVNITFYPLFVIGKLYENEI